jgi:hypothetical protein
MQTAMSNACEPMRADRGPGDRDGEIGIGHAPTAPGLHIGCIARAGAEKIGEDRP